MILAVVLVEVVFVVIVLVVMLVHLHLTSLAEAAAAFIGGKRGQGHANGAAYELRLHIDVAHGGEVGLDALNDFHAEFLVSHFAATELEVDFHLVALVEELLGVADLGVIIVVVDIDAEFDFLDATRGVLLFFFLLGQVITELAKIQKATNGGLRIGSDLNEIKPETTGLAKSLIGAQNTELLVSYSVDDPDLPGTNAFIDADISYINRASLVPLVQ